jgi:enolase-phosphatase E1
VGLEPGLILFLSDVSEELDAAAAAGLATGLVIRPGNRPTASERHPRLESFDELTCERSETASRWAAAD